MSPTTSAPDAPFEVTLPRRAGVSLKPEHYTHILGERPDMGWFEVHPENYMGAGGPPHRYLKAVREHYALSLHGVGLSIGAAGDLDREHISRLKALVDRYQPEQISEHLAWSTHDEGFLNDLLPLPYTEETLTTVCDHIDAFQEAVGRRMLLENPATYVVFPESTYGEIEFLKEIVRRTDCGLLLDVNNVYVSCTNHNRDAESYIDRFPLDRVGEIHLAGHHEESDETGARLLIDSHDRPVVEDVWALYERTIQRAGALPTLIEWDSDIPEWPVLSAEADRANAIMAAGGSQTMSAANKPRTTEPATHELA